MRASRTFNAETETFDFRDWFERIRRQERLQMYQIIGHGINSGIEFVIAIGSTLMIMVSNRLRVVR